MILLALDISTKSTGIAVYKDTQLIHYECAAAASNNIFNRIDKITAQVEEVILKYKVDTIIAEDPLPAQSGHNMQVYKKLTWIQGILGDMFNKHKLIYNELVTSSWWRSKTGVKTGRGVKRQNLKAKDIAMVKDLYGIDVNDDVADAILIGKAYIAQHFKQEFNWE